MATLYDIAHFCVWNGYVEDMRGYLGTCREAWTNDEFWFPYALNMRFGEKKKTRMQRICEEMYGEHNPNNLYWGHLMVSYNAVKRIETMLDLGANPNIADTNGVTPLHVCARNGWNKHSEIVKLLVKRGADVNRMTSACDTALHYAAYNNRKEIVKCLIANGAKVHGINSSGDTALDNAIFRGNIEIAKMLIAAGAVATNNTMKNAIQNTESAVRSIKFLHSMGCPMEEASVFRAACCDNPEAIRALIACRQNPDIGGDAFTPLEIAIINNQEMCVTELCKGGANLELISPNLAERPIHLALNHRKFNIVRILCKYKADAGAYNAAGDTPLHRIITHASFGNPMTMDALKDFMRYVKDFNAKDGIGCTAFDIAMHHGLKDIAQEIKRASLRNKGAPRRRAV